GGGGAPRPGAREGESGAGCENGGVVRDAPTRAADLTVVQGSVSPLERVNAEVQRRLGGHFSYTRAVTFANQGGKKGRGGRWPGERWQRCWWGCWGLGQRRAQRRPRGGRPRGGRCRPMLAAP